MTGDVTVVQTCGACGTEVGTFSVKRENMMLFSQKTVWCPTCQAERPEVRDVAGRNASIQREKQTYPRS